MAGDSGWRMQPMRNNMMLRIITTMMLMMMMMRMMMVRIGWRDTLVEAETKHRLATKKGLVIPSLRPANIDPSLPEGSAESLFVITPSRTLPSLVLVMSRIDDRGWSMINDQWSMIDDPFRNIESQKRTPTFFLPGKTRQDRAPIQGTTDRCIITAAAGAMLPIVLPPSFDDHCPCAFD